MYSHASSQSVEKGGSQIPRAGHSMQKFGHQTIQKKQNKTGLPDSLKSGIESLSGYSMDDVKVHYNSKKPAQLQAHAYAQGTNIHVASGQEKHLAHEAWHVVQQKQGRVRPTTQMKGGIHINDNTHLEQEADVMGKKALQMKTIKNPENFTNPIVQRHTIQLNGIFKFFRKLGKSELSKIVIPYIRQSPLRKDYLEKVDTLKSVLIPYATTSRIFMDEGIGAPPDMQAEVAVMLRQKLKDETREKQPLWAYDFIKWRQGDKYKVKQLDPSVHDLMMRKLFPKGDQLGSPTLEDSAIDVILSAAKPDPDISQYVAKWIEAEGIEAVEKMYETDDSFKKYLTSEFEEDDELQR
jgi:hypothetical protein